MSYPSALFPGLGIPGNVSRVFLAQVLADDNPPLLIGLSANRRRALTRNEKNRKFI